MSVCSVRVRLSLNPTLITRHPLEPLPYNPSTPVSRKVLGNMETKVVQEKEAEVLSDEERKELSNIFKLWDNDSGGGITFDEIVHALRNILNPIDLKDIQEMFQMMDTNNDGTVELHEFFK
jgi:Ca2+-binding EF-hand superfamily protein